MKHSLRTEWFYRAQWGLFMHFLSEAPGGNGSNWGEVSVASWNRQVEAFDVEKLARQLHEFKVGYFFLTLGQNSGYYCSPNATYDRLCGRTPETSRCSRRDLPADLCAALKKYGIPLMVYLPSHAPMHDPAATMALKCVPPWDFGSWSPEDQAVMAPARDDDSRIGTFQRNWEAIIREWSLRWGAEVRGWWFDGCYFADRLYRFADEPNFSSFAAAVRAGNSNSLIAWNPGVVYPPETISAEEDYTGGEINEPDRTQCLGRWVEQAQFHMLSYLGQTWGDPRIRFTADELAGLTRRITDNDGVVTWDVPYDHADGSLTPEALAVLADFSRQMQTPRRSVAAPVPLVKGKIGGGADREAVLEFFNPHDFPIAGQMTFRLDPVDTFQPLPPLDFSLAPGGKMSCVLPVRPIASSPLILYASLTVSCCGIEQRFRFPCRSEIRAPRPERRYPVYGPHRELLAEVGFGLDAEANLRVSGTVYDAAPQLQPVPWQGSGLEVFMMPKGNLDALLQVFTTPAAAALPAAVRRKTKTAYPAISEAVIRTAARDDGYDIELILPLSLIAVDGKIPSSIELEMQVTVSIPRGYCRGTLFGSPRVFASTEYYAVVSP